MHCLTRLPIALLVYTLASAGEPGYFLFKHPGYMDTPFIPGSAYRVHQENRPLPERVIPAEAEDSLGARPPSDATVLFGGSSLDRFQENEWKIENGHLVATEGSLATKQAYGDCQLHVEWRTPSPPRGEPTGSIGNSGIFFMGLYELQIYDSYSSMIYADGGAGAIYGQSPPLANASRRPGEWQSFDVFFTAPEFEGDQLVAAARITALHNGVLVQNHTEVLGPTKHKSALPYVVHLDQLPLRFQGHNSPVQFRNIWIRDLESRESD